MNNRTLQSLIVYVFIFGSSTASLPVTCLAFLYSDGSMWAPIASGLIWFVSLCGAGLCYRDLRNNAAGFASCVDEQKANGLNQNC